MKTFIISVLILFLLGGAGGYYLYYRFTHPTEPETETAALEINNTKLNVEIARSDEQWTQGLSDRPSMTDDNGMLFVSERPILPGFWMHGMLFPLDIIWIRNNEIIGIEKDLPKPASADTPLKTYYPSEAVDMVLEVNAGWSDEHNVKVGDRVSVQYQS